MPRIKRDLCDGYRFARRNARWLWVSNTVTFAILFLALYLLSQRF